MSNIKMLSYDRIDVSESIDVNKTSPCIRRDQKTVYCLLLSVFILSLNRMSAMGVKMY